MEHYSAEEFFFVNFLSCLIQKFFVILRLDSEFFRCFNRRMLHSLKLYDGDGLYIFYFVKIKIVSFAFFSIVLQIIQSSPVKWGMAWHASHNSGCYVWIAY